MKRKDLIRQIEKQGCILIRHGGKHDIYQNPHTGISQPIPRACHQLKHLTLVDNYDVQVGLR